MHESLTSRVGRIVSGSVNAVVSAVENAAPELVMQEAMREVDSAIDEVRLEMGRAVATKHLASSRLMEESRKHDELVAKIATAVKESRDDLAEAGIARQLDIEAQIPVLEKAVAEAGDREKELDGYIQALQARKREMKEELNRMLQLTRDSEAAAANTGGAASSGSSVENKVARAESAFERLMEEQTGLAGSDGLPDRDTAAKLAELEELNRNNRIQERLAAFKADAGDA